MYIYRVHVDARLNTIVFQRGIFRVCDNHNADGLRSCLITFCSNASKILINGILLSKKTNKLNDVSVCALWVFHKYNNNMFYAPYSDFAFLIFRMRFICGLDFWHLQMMLLHSPSLMESTHLKSDLIDFAIVWQYNERWRIIWFVYNAFLSKSNT